MAIKMETLALEIVKPSSPTPHNLKHHKFSFLDQNLPPSHVPLVLFYQQASSLPNLDDHSQIRRQLKQFLSDALTKFYLLAGKIDEDDLSVDCNDSGVLFVEAQVQASISQATKRTTIENLDQFLPTVPYAFSNTLLAVQINFFECGGIAIGACISHRIADLMSFVAFLTAWAAICHGKKEIMQPNFDLGCQYFPPVHISRSLPSMENAENATPILVEEKLVKKRFVFDKEKLLNLKALAEVKHPTRVEVVTAFILKQLIEINFAKVDPKRMFAFSHSVNLRSQLRQHELPPNDFAFGNFSPMFRSALLMTEEQINYHDLIIAMRSMLRKFKEDQVLNLQNEVVSASDDIMSLFTKPEVLYYYFTSWCKFPFNEVDYGWGKPAVVCTYALPAKNTVILMDTVCGEGIQALVTLGDKDMAMLPNEFLSLENNDFSK